MEAYPLQWPVGYPRAKNQQRSLFSKHTITQCQNEIKEQVRMLKGKNVIISTNIPIRKDGKPYIDYERRVITDTGVAVYFIFNDKQSVLACDKWETIEENLWAVAKSIENMRGLNRWGVSQLLERAFSGLNALPMIATINPWDILDMEPTTNKEAINARYKELAKVRQFDDAAMRDLNNARDQLMKE